MRLLTRNERGELSLIERTGNNIPQYAILSHTWDKDGEVNYNDLVGGTGKNKPGYKKIEFCMEQAARDGLQYSWVDTCCIDKWNLQELSNAINLMFLWYQNAAKCYVLLSDVPLANTTDEILDNTTWETDFQGSRWFRRGWTLQELIAPKCIDFFSAQHQRLGDKRSLERQIHKITGIPIEALRGSSLDTFTVEERMAWTKTRETTEEEDSAYCLLGIFGVQMPASYGEGKDNALNRLRREVESAESTPFLVPFDRNAQFTGRESQLTMLDKALFVNGDKTAITGAGGIGKTQLALELAYRMREQYKSCAVLWIPAVDMESLHQGYVHIAQRLGIPGWNNEKSDVRGLVQHYLNQESAGQWMLVFDNADDISLWMAEPGSRAGAVGLMQYLPSSKQGCIVFTTRDTGTAIKLGAQNIVEVSKMDQDIAQILLQKCLTNRDLKEEQQEASLLLGKLNYLPLAITLAGAYINVNKTTTLQEYLSLLATQKDKSIGLLSEDIENGPISRADQQPLAVTWLISFEQIFTQNQFAADCMSFMACIEQRDIPLSLLPTGASAREDAVKMLADYSMIIRRPAGLALDIHQLVHIATQNWLRKEGQLVEWTERAIGQLEESFPQDDHWNRNKWRRLLPHAKYLLKIVSTGEDTSARAALMWKCAMALYQDGRYSEAEKLFVQMMETRKTKLGADHPSTLTSMASLASTYRNQGRWEEAEKLEVQVMEISKTKLRADHPSTLISMANLASTLWNQGRWEEAEKLFVQVMETCKTKLGADHPDTLTSMANLASTYRNQGRWEEAEKLEVQVMEMSKMKLGADHPSTLTSMANLASTYRNQGRWEEAEKLEVQVMETRKTKLGADHPSTLTSMANLASTLWNQGRWEEAEKLFMQVMETRKTKLGADHPSTLTSMANLASTYRNQGRWEEAEKLEVQVMEISKTKLRADHPSTLISMANLASTLWNQGRWEEAEKLFVQVMETCKMKLGADHPDTLTSMANLASTYRNQGRWEEAEKLEVQVMEMSKTKLGADHPDTLTSMANLASTLWNQGRWEKAEKLFMQVMETRKTKLGADHPSTLTSMANLASTLWNQGRWEEAEKLFMQVMETRKTKLGADHPSTLTSMANLASTYRNQGRWEEAEKLFMQVIEMSKTKLGADHPDTLTSMNNLAHTWKTQGKRKEALILMKQCVEAFSHVLGPSHPNTLTVLQTHSSWEAEA